MTQLDPFWVKPEVIRVCAGCADYGTCSVPKTCENYCSPEGRCLFRQEAVQ